MTSAPRCASWSVQKGPAHTQVKSATRTPASGARLAIYTSPSRASAAASRPISASTSAACWPRQGAGARSVHGVAESLYGAPGTVTAPARGCSMAAQKPRAPSCREGRPRRGGRGGKGGPSGADGGIQAGLEAGLVAERFEGRGVGAGGLAVQRRDAAGAPGDDVGAAVAGVRPAEPEGRDRGHDQRRVRGRQALVVEAVARHLARVDVVYQEGGARREALEDLAPARPGEIEREAALVG